MINDVQIVVRLPSDIVHKLDEIAKMMTKKTPGVKVSRAAVVRMMAIQGINAMKAEEGGRKCRKA